MAAAEYFSSAPMHHPTPHQATPTSYPQGLVSSPGFSQSRPNMQSQAPPPYQEQKPGVHFAPSPVMMPQRHSFSGQQQPQNQWEHPPQQGYGNPYPQQNMAMQPYQPQQQQPYGTSPNSYGAPQQRPQYLSPHMRPYANPNSSQYSLEHGGYSSDPEPHRRKHSHRHRRDSGETRSTKSKSSSRSTNADAFVGAAGGGLIGDLIFPGLGTVGGAALGWLGGKDYGHHRKGRETTRQKEQRKWEEKYGHRHRSGSRDYDSRDSSAHRSDRDRRHSGY